MKDFDALKDIWSAQAKHPKISSEDILKHVKQSKRQFANRLLFEVILMIAAIGMLASTWFTFDFQMWTSYIAVGIFIICVGVIAFIQFKDYRRLIDSSLLLNQPQEYIEYLKSYKKGRMDLNTRKYKFYTLIFILGFSFLFIEMFFVASLLVTIGGIIFTAFWFIVCYFFLMKSYIRKEENKLNEMITDLERLQQQFNNELA